MAESQNFCIKEFAASLLTPAVFPTWLAKKIMFAISSLPQGGEVLNSQRKENCRDDMFVLDAKDPKQPKKVKPKFSPLG